MILSREDKICVQGITGREASEMVKDSLDYGSQIVSGVTPGKGGQEVHGVPVFNSVHEAVQETQATVSIISVPAPFVLDAALESIDAGICLILIMSERVPRLDTVKIIQEAKNKKVTVIGPNTLGFIRPGIAKLGTIGGRLDNVKKSFSPGRTAILSRSGGMTTEIASFLTSRGIGQSIAIGVGGDSIIGSNFTDLIDSIEQDPETDTLIIYGEPGGSAEEQLAERLKIKPSRLKIKAYLAGNFVEELEGIRFGHAAVLVENGRGSIREKKKALQEAGVEIAETFEDLCH